MNGSAIIDGGDQGVVNAAFIAAADTARFERAALEPVLHVLLIEDDPLVASGIVAGLRLHGLTADHVASAAQAHAALQASHFDVGVLDLGLPHEDGMAALARWRARRVAAGADDYLLKPFDFDEGPGMTSADATQATQRFWRRDSGATGSGLGLSIVAAIARRHAGELRLERRTGAGMKASLTVPACWTIGADAELSRDRPSCRAVPI